MLQYKCFKSGQEDLSKCMEKLEMFIGKENILKLNENIIAVSYNYINTTFSRVRNYANITGFEEFQFTNEGFLKLNDVCLKEEYFVTNVKIKSDCLDYESPSELTNEARKSTEDLKKSILDYEAEIKEFSFSVPCTVNHLRRNINIYKEGIILMDDKYVPINIKEIVDILLS